MNKIKSSPRFERGPGENIYRRLGALGSFTGTRHIQLHGLKRYVGLRQMGVEVGGVFGVGGEPVYSQATGQAPVVCPSVLGSLSLHLQ